MKDNLRFANENKLITYEEMFPRDHYKESINPKNQETVDLLNKIVEEINTKYVDPTNFSEDEFKNTINRIHNLIFQRGSDHWYKVA